MRGLRSTLRFTFAAVLLVGCGTFQLQAGPPPAPPSYGGADAATLRVQVEEMCCYVEGAIEVLQLDGPITAEWSVEEVSEARIAPGAYTLTAYEQVCNGNCGELAPPSGHCDIDLDVARGESVEVQVTFGDSGPCTAETIGEER